MTLSVEAAHKTEHRKLVQPDGIAVGKSPSETTVALLTFVLQAHHCVILEDWVNFFDYPIDELIVHVGSDEQALPRIQEICKKHNIALRNLGVTTARETTDDEAILLAAQFDATTSDFACVIRLDTLPFRQEGLRWQDEAIEQMQASGAAFLTGSTLPYRADRPLHDQRYRMTQRVSNCFMMIRPQVWRDLQVGEEAAKAQYGRFFVEGVVEDNLVKEDLWGIRILNSPAFRIFHCQEWGPRLIFVRDTFQKGKNIKPYLKGFQDDYFGANTRNYMERKPPIVKRVRIFLGRWRRHLFGQIL